MGLGVYIHIPFCKRKCPYCDFYSISFNRDIANKYISIVSEELEKINLSVDTVYIGGGTPTVLGVDLFKKMFLSLAKLLPKAKEITVEANPESLTKDLLKVFIDNKVNRLSIGVQSLNNNMLKILKRPHDAAQAISAVELAKKMKIERVSIDLIYGIFEQTLQQWENDLEKAVTLEIDHISAYALSCEKNSSFYPLKEKINDNLAALMYSQTMKFLPEKGFYQYEVSNYAKEGKECLHNLNCWRGFDYIGIGASAVSFFNRKRIKNISSVERYIKCKLQGKDCFEYVEQLNDIDRAKEYAAVKIRTKEGIDINGFKKITGFCFFDLFEPKLIENLENKGFLYIKEEKNKPLSISATEKGFLFCDEISSAFV